MNVVPPSEMQVADVRVATMEDSSSLAWLARTAEITNLPADEIAHLMETGWFLVVQQPGGELLGAVHVLVSGSVGLVDHLLIHPDHRTRDLEVRLASIGSAVCATLGTSADQGLDPEFGPM